MKQTVLANDNSVGISFAGESDKFKKIANILMMADRLFGDETDDESIAYGLEKHGIEPSKENIEKVWAFFSMNTAK